MYLLSDILHGLVYLVVLTTIGIALKVALTPPGKQSLADDADFDEFYCDLCGSDLTVDFSRAEAEILYRTWQQQQKMRESERC